MQGKNRLRWISGLLLVCLLVQIVGAPLASIRMAQAAIERLGRVEGLSREASLVLEALQQAGQRLAPEVEAAPPLHDPGDTDAEPGCEDCADPCKQGGKCGSQVQYDNRALSLSAVLGSAGLSFVALYNSRYELNPVPLAAWVPTKQPIDDWEIRIQGWTYKGTGSRPLAFWDTTNKDSGQPVPAGAYEYEVSYGNELGRGSTRHTVIVRRAADGPLGYNWVHGFESHI